MTTNDTSTPSDSIFDKLFTFLDCFNTRDRDEAKENRNSKHSNVLACLFLIFNT